MTGAHAASYYAATASGAIDFPALQGDLACDVCVVGAGFAGLTAALHLAERGFSVAVVEARFVGWGASGRNGGQMGSGQRRDQIALEAMVGRARARALWDLAQEAKAEVRSRVKRHAIACGLKDGVMTVGHRPRHGDWLARYAEHLRRAYDYRRIAPLTPAEVRERLGSTVYYGGNMDAGGGHLHPLNYALGLARAARAAGVRVFERSPALDIAGGARPRVRCVRGAAAARFVVVACNGYLERLAPRLRAAVMPINSYMIATEPLGAARARDLIRDDAAVADSRFAVNYFRLSADQRLLFGGGETYRRRFPRDIKAFVRPRMLTVFPQLADAAIAFGWGGTLAVTPGRMPSFGRMDGSVFYAQGFCGHGVAMTAIAGKLIAEAAAGTVERFDVLARVPQPRFPGGALLRWPGLVAGMLYYNLRDRL